MEGDTAAREVTAVLLLQDEHREGQWMVAPLNIAREGRGRGKEREHDGIEGSLGWQRKSSRGRGRAGRGTAAD